MKIVSWNVNGLRAAQRKGFLDWLAGCDADVVHVQETKAAPEQLSDELRAPPGWHAHFSAARRKGYSGVALYARARPDEVVAGFGLARFDDEGRVLMARYGNRCLFGVYFPNGGQGPERVKYKLEFYEAMLAHMNGLRKKGRAVVVSGDYNTAHTAIDLARPKENEGTSGFLPQERAWIDRYVDAGWADTFRRRHPDARDAYTWWSFRANARARNVGWRIDYHFVDAALLGAVRAADIHAHVEGSDHCPISLELADE